MLMSEIKEVILKVGQISVMKLIAVLEWNFYE